MLPEGCRVGEVLKVGLLAVAAELLGRDGSVRVPGDQLEAQDSGAWTVWDALVEAAGCSRKAGPLAYWEHRELKAALAECFDAIATAAGAVDGDGWCAAAGRRQAEVVGVLSRAAGDGDVEVGPVRLRVWSDPGLSRTCRVPYVPLAVVTHAWAVEPCGLAELLDRFEVTSATDPWDLRDLVEPAVVEVDAPGQVREIAEALREQMKAHVPETHSPAAYLWTFATAAPRVRLDELVGLGA